MKPLTLILALLTGCAAPAPGGFTPPGDANAPAAHTTPTHEGPAVAATPATCTPGVAATIGPVAYPTLQDAFDAVLPDDEVVVCPGTHLGPHTLTSDGPVYVRGATGRADDVVLDGQGVGAAVGLAYSMAGFELRDVTIRGSENSSGEAFEFSSYSHFVDEGTWVRLLNVTFDGNDAENWCARLTAATVELRDVTFRNSTCGAGIVRPTSFAVRPKLIVDGFDYDGQGETLDSSIIAATMDASGLLPPSDELALAEFSNIHIRNVRLNEDWALRLASYRDTAVVLRDSLFEDIVLADGQEEGWLWDYGGYELGYQVVTMGSGPDWGGTVLVEDVQFEDIVGNAAAAMSLGGDVTVRDVRLLRIRPWIRPGSFPLVDQPFLLYTTDAAVLEDVWVPPPGHPDHNTDMSLFELCSPTGLLNLTYDDSYVCSNPTY